MIHVSQSRGGGTSTNQVGRVCTIASILDPERRISTTLEDMSCLKMICKCHIATYLHLLLAALFFRRLLIGWPQILRMTPPNFSNGNAASDIFSLYMSLGKTFASNMTVWDRTVISEKKNVDKECRTVKSHSNGFQGTNKFYLLQMEFCLSQW